MQNCMQAGSVWVIILRATLLRSFKNAIPQSNAGQATALKHKKRKKQCLSVSVAIDNCFEIETLCTGRP